jgi:hypothetical protein
MSFEEYVPSPEVLAAEADTAAIIREQRAAGWIDPDSLTLRRPGWLDRMKNAEGEQIVVPPFERGETPTAVEMAGQRLDAAADAVKRTIDRSVSIIAAHELEPETAAVGRLRVNPPRHVTAEMVLRAEETYQVIAQRAQAGQAFLGEQAVSKQAFAEELQQRGGPVPVAAGKEASSLQGEGKAEVIEKGYKLSTGTYILGKRAELLNVLEVETAGFRTISTSRLFSVLYPGEEDTRQARTKLSVLISDTRKGLGRAKAPEQLSNLSSLNTQKQAEYALLPPNAGFSNYELLNLLQFLGKQHVYISGLGVAPLESTKLKELMAAFSQPDRPRGHIDQDEINRRREVMFSKVQVILEHPLREGLLAAIEGQDARIGMIFKHVTDIHAALQKAGNRQPVSAFLLQSGSVVSYDAKERVVLSNGGK